MPLDATWPEKPGQAHRTVLYWVQQFAPLLARAGHRAATRRGQRWWCDETSVCVGGQAAHRYRVIDEHGQMVDVVLRIHRDLASAHACFILATFRRRTLPKEMITDKHPAYVRAMREEMPGATHTQSGLHRKSGSDTKPIARSHIPTQDRLRPLRGLQSIRTGQRIVEGIELARAVRWGHVAAPATLSAGDAGRHAQARRRLTEA